MIMVQCDSCGAKFKAPDEYAGKSGKCRSCGKPVFVPENSNVERREYAGFWRRLAAYVIDGLIFGYFTNWIYWNMVNRFTAQVMESGSYERAQLIANIAVVPVNIMIYWCYFAGLESSPLQATIGKLGVGIYVTDLDGRRISFARATGRHFGKAVSGMVLFVGFLMAGFTKEKQALHDLMAGCLVLRK